MRKTLTPRNHNNRPGDRSKLATRGTTPGRDRPTRKDDRVRHEAAVPDFPGTGDIGAAASASDEPLPPTSPELERILDLRAHKLKEGSPAQAAAYMRDEVRPDLISLQGGALFARYWFLTACFKMVAVIRTLRMDEHRLKAVKKSLGVNERSTKPYLALFHALGPITAPRGSPERKRDLDRYSDYHCALKEAYNQGLNANELLARLVRDGGIQGLLEEARSKADATEASGDPGERVPRDTRSQRRRREKEEEAALATLARRAGLAADADIADAGGSGQVVAMELKSVANEVAGEAEARRRYPVRAVKRQNSSDVGSWEEYSASIPVLSIAKKAERAIGARGRYSATVFVSPGTPPQVEILTMKRLVAKGRST